MIYSLNNAPFDINIEHHINGVNYPAGWFISPVNRTIMGIIESPAPVPIPPTALEVLTMSKQNLSSQVGMYLNQVAATKGYDSIISACSYASVPNAFQAESIRFVTWRTSVWTIVFTIYAEMDAGTRVTPTFTELKALLPIFV
jgi:hypothetical protein